MRLVFSQLSPAYDSNGSLYHLDSVFYCNSKNPILSSKTAGWLYHATYFKRDSERYNGYRGGFYAKQPAAIHESGAVFFVYAAQILFGGRKKRVDFQRKQNQNERSRRVAAVCGAWRERFLCCQNNNILQNSFGFFGGKTAIRYLYHRFNKSLKDRSAGGVGLI